MTNTTPNVPRDLLNSLLTVIESNGYAADEVEVVDELRALLSAPSPANHVEDVRAMVAAPSPAGVDGLEVVGWYRMDDHKAITPYPSVCATWHKMGAKVGAAYSDSAQSTVDGLRYEIDRLIRESSKANPNYHLKLQIECDRSAKRIGELEGLLRHAQKQVPTGSGLHMRIDAALSAGKEGE